MATRSVASSVIYFSSVTSELLEFYRVDLESLPEKLNRITDFEVEDVARHWTVIDECIYCTGGLKYESGRQTNVSKNIYKYDTTIIHSTWEIISSHKNFRWYKPFVFSIDKKLYIFGGSKFSTPYIQNPDTDYSRWGEYYDLESQTLLLLPFTRKHFEDNGFYNTDHATVMNKNTIVFYSFSNGHMLFYDVVTEKITLEKQHSNLIWFRTPEPQWSGGINRTPKGLGDCKHLDLLFDTAKKRKPVVRDSTLYWFSNDMCLYGYDFLMERWFQSNCLGNEIEWELPLDSECLFKFPLLLDLQNGTFLVMTPLGTDKLGIAVLNFHKGSSSLYVSKQWFKSLDVDTSDYINPVYGMAILKNEGSTLGKRKFSMEE